MPLLEIVHFLFYLILGIMSLPHLHLKTYTLNILRMKPHNCREACVVMFILSLKKLMTYVK